MSHNPLVPRIEDIMELQDEIKVLKSRISELEDAITKPKPKYVTYSQKQVSVAKGLRVHLKMQYEAIAEKVGAHAGTVAGWLNES